MASPVKDAKNKHVAEGFTEIAERGKGFLRSRKPGTDQYAMTTQVGGRGWHFGAEPYNVDSEVNTAWQVSSGQWDYEVTANDFHSFVRDSVPVSYRYYDADTEHYVEITVNAVEWVNDENDSEEAASFSQVTPTIDDDLIAWEDIATGWDIRIEAQTARLAKWLDIDSLANLGSPTIGGTNIRLQMRFTFQKSSGLEVWVDGVQWDEKNNTFKETTGDIEFRDETTQLPIFWFKRPIGYDFDGDSAPMSQRVRRAGANFYSEIDTPWSWLSGATYPISLDDTIDEQVVASADDARETGGASVSITATVYRMNAANEQQGARWAVPTITNSDTITLATVDYSLPNVNADEPNHDLKVEDVDSAAAYQASASDISGRSYQTGVNDATGDLGVTADDWWSEHSTLPDLSTPVGLTIGRGGWSPGNYLAVAIVWAASGGDLDATMYDGSTSLCAKLHIEYTAGAGRTTKNTDPYGLGIAAGVSRTIKIGAL